MTTQPTPDEMAKTVVVDYLKSPPPKSMSESEYHIHLIATAIRDYHEAHTPKITDAELAELVESTAIAIARRRMRDEGPSHAVAFIASNIDAFNTAFDSTWAGTRPEDERQRTTYRKDAEAAIESLGVPSLLQAAAENAQAREIIRDLRRKLAEAGVEGSPPPGSMGTIPTLAAENKRLREAAQNVSDAVGHGVTGCSIDKAKEIDTAICDLRVALQGGR